MRSYRENRTSGPFSFFLILTVFAILTTCVEPKKIEQEQRRIRDLRGNKNVRIVRQVEASNETEYVLNNGTEEQNETKREYRNYTKLSRTIKYKQFELPDYYDKWYIPTRKLGEALLGNSITSEEVLEVESSSPYFINVTLRIKNIDDLDENEEEFSFLADLIITWTDHVIEVYAKNKFNLENVNVEEFLRTMDLNSTNEIWKPDVYIDDLVKVNHPELMRKPITLRINQVTGQVEYIAKLRIHIKCDMDFYFYPADTQTCEVVLRSSSYDAHLLELRWSSNDTGVTLDDNSGSNFDFQVKDPKQDIMNEDYIETPRKFSVLRFDILARRKLSYHLVQTYMPSAFFIVITWLCFLLPKSMIEARIGISMTTLLTLTAMFSSVRQSSPSVSYVRFIDFWMTGCIVFVFLVLLEFSVLCCLKHLNKNAKPGESVNEDNEGKASKFSSHGDLEVKVIEIKRIIVTRKALTDAVHLIAEFVDNHAFLIFSSIFFFLVLVYWVVLLFLSDHLHWDVNKTINWGKIVCKYKSNLTEICGG